MSSFQRHSRFHIGVLAVLLLLAPGHGSAAQQAGSLAAKVTDVSGAVVPQAAIRVRNLTTGEIRRGATDDRGDFRDGSLPPGKYLVVIERPGFVRFAPAPVEIAAGGAAAINAVLKVDIADSEYVEQKSPYNIKNFWRVNEQVCTGGQPSMDDLTKMKADGIKTILNLRRPSEYNYQEEAAKAKELGLRYFHIPVESNAPKDEQVDEFLKIMGDTANRPVFAHCMSNSRVASFWMIRRVLVENWTLPAAEREATRMGLSNPKTREFAVDYVLLHQAAASKPQ